MAVKIMKTLREATTEVIRTFGIDILDDSRRCLSSLADLIDGESAEALVLYKHCDDRLLSRYSMAAKSRSAGALESTYKGTVEYLVNDCYVGREAAEKVAGGLALGIADSLGITIRIDKGYTPVTPVRPEEKTDGRGGSIKQPPLPPELSLHAAVNETLHKEGVGILRSPSRLNNALSSKIDGDSPEAFVLFRYGDDRLYAPFAQAAESGKQHKLAAVQEQRTKYLQDVCGVNIYDSRLVTNGLTQGICEALGWSYPPKPGLSTFAKVVLGVLAVGAMVVAGIISYILFVPSNPVLEDPVTISFNSNGADSGAVDAITCESGEAIPLPAGSNYAREGYTFAGWGETRSDDTPLGVGETFSTSSDVTLYALWDLGSESKPKVLKEKRFSSDSGSEVLVVTIKNLTRATVDLKGEFSFRNADDTVVDTQKTNAWSVGPGETTILEASSEVGGIQTIAYDIESSTPEYSEKSLLTSATVEEVSCNDSGLTVRVTNKGDGLVTLVTCLAYGYDEDDNIAFATVSYEGDEQIIQPRQSKTVLFEGNQWTSLDYKVYLYGFAK